MGEVSISAIYIAATVVFLAAMSFRVSLLRQKHQVSLGDGGVPELERGVRAFGNGAEHAPLCLFVVLAAELLGAPGFVVHLLGAATLFSLVATAYGIMAHVLPARMAGGLATMAVEGIGGLGLLLHALFGSGA